MATLQPEGTNQPAVSLAAIFVKFPPFWPADPQVWFAQIEAQFTTRNISSQKTRFDYVVASLAPEFATEVRDLILKPPEEDPYDARKEQLIRNTAASEQRRLQMLFNTEERGDRKPTQLLRRMQQLLGDSAGPESDSSFLRELFLERLPGGVRMVLASTGNAISLEALAQMADKFVEVATPTISAINAPHISSELDRLRKGVAHLREIISSLNTSPGSSRPSRSRGRSPSPHPTNSTPTTCWYHRRFGEKARKCNSPCDYSGNEPAVTSGDECYWATSKSPLLYQGTSNCYAFSGGNRS